MKFLHLSDLHIGKKVNGFSMLYDQEYIFEQILNIINTKKPDALLIAGDVYDKTVPSIDAVRLFDDFLTKVSALSVPAFIISGNHDSIGRISFGAKLMEKSNVYFSPQIKEKITPHIMHDEFGEVRIYMLPFIRPAQINHINEKNNNPDTVTTYDEAVRYAVSNFMDIDKSKRNIIISHQFVTGAKTCDSEEMSVGGLENISVDIYKDFDYAALGHIHSPQNIKYDHIRYSGTPLKYSFSEADDIKTVPMITLREKGVLDTEFIELTPLLNMRIVKGYFNDLINPENETADYIKVVLYDEEDIPDAIGKLRLIYKNIMNLEYKNKRTSLDNDINFDFSSVKKKSDLELLDTFYEMQNNCPMSASQRKLALEIFEEIKIGGNI